MGCEVALILGTVTKAVVLLTDVEKPGVKLWKVENG